MGFVGGLRVKYAIHPSGLKAFGKHLRELRRAQGLSQEELAWKADSELSQISRMERGVVNAGLSQVFKIAEALGVHPRVLFDFELPVEEKPKNQITLSAQEEEAKASGLALNTKPMLRIYPIASFRAVLLSNAGSVLMSA